MCFPLEPVFIRDGEGVPNFTIEPYMVTNMGKSRFVDLTESVSEGKKVNRWTIPGEGIQGKEYDEYVVDDDALYEKTVETFYVEKK